MHLSGEHQVSTRARAGQGEGWRGEDTGPRSPERESRRRQQDEQVMWLRGLACLLFSDFPPFRSVAWETPGSVSGPQLPVCQKGRGKAPQYTDVAK